MPKPVHPGDKLTVSTKKSDALALAWLNSQRNRSEAVMGLIREAATQAFLPKEKLGEPSAKAVSRREVQVHSSTDRVLNGDSFSGLGQFLDALDAFGTSDV